MKKPPVFLTDINSSHKLLLSCKDLNLEIFGRFARKRIFVVYFHKMEKILECFLY